VVIGGGVIGLSLAWDLARHGCSVHVIDQGEPGREASWAGAGILPAASSIASQHPYEQLRGLACQLHPQWAAELKAQTGIDTGYRRCGGLHLARTPGEAAALAAWAALVHEEGIAVERVSATDLGEIEPGLARSVVVSANRTQDQSSQPLTTAFLLPDEAQLRNPWHLGALVAACERAGVKISSQIRTAGLTHNANELTAVQTAVGPVRARQYCFTAGAWTGQMLQRLGIATGIMPVRGQMVLFRCDEPPIKRIVNEGSRYLVPREDGRVLAGSTEEEVGFDKRTTEEAVADLTDFARGLVPALREASIEQVWAGLRPGSFDGLPYLGPLPGLTNAFVAAGHFRSGLFLSTATAVVMSQLIRDEQPQIDLAPFRVGR
jgi:glycine oxidase